MIHEATLEAVYPLAELLARRGKRVTPLDSTPIDQLSKAGHLPLPTRGIDELPTSEGRILQGSRSKDAMGACTHDVVMDELVEVISQTVRNNLDLSRNQINPIVKEVALDTEEYIRDAQAIHKTHVSVVPVHYAAIWNSPVLSEMVARYQETALRNVDLRLEIPGATDRDALLVLAKTGASRFDEEVEEWMAGLDESTLLHAWHSVFGNSRVRELRNVVSSFKASPENGRGDIALLVHLWARKLLQDPPEGVSMGLEAYRAYVSDILAQSGRVLVAVQDQREKNIQLRQLIFSWPTSPSQIGQHPIELLVNGDVYGQWLEQGGEPDAIIGSFVTDQQRGFTALLENGERYAKEWERQSRVLGTTQRMKRFNHGVEGLRQAIARQINELDDDVLVVSREQYHQRLEQGLKTLKNNFHQHIYVVARMLVCNVLFPHTHGLEILTAIDQAAEDHPGIEVREAALLATIEIVSAWVVKLCKVEGVD